MELLGLSALATAVLTGLVAGVVELVKRVFDKDIKAVITILLSAVVGAVCAPMLGGEMLSGIVFGMAATGYVTVAQNIGKKSS